MLLLLLLPRVYVLQQLTRYGHQGDDFGPQHMRVLPMTRHMRQNGEQEVRDVVTTLLWTE